MNTAARGATGPSWSGGGRLASHPPGAGTGTAKAVGVDRWGFLMASAQGGDERAYQLLLSELQTWLRRYYSRRLPADSVADAVQEALLAAHSNRSSYTPSRPFGPWISAIARYKWVDFVRESTRRRTVELKDDVAVPDHSARVTSSILVEDLLTHLKPAQADVINLVKLEGESVRGAARRTGQSEALVKVNVHRGIRKLATLVD
jgi:RNA polymerase sigma factor (sigma-70 family)